MGLLKVAGFSLLLALAGCGQSVEERFQESIGKVDSFPTVVEGHMEWRAPEPGAVVDAGEEGEEGDEEFQEDESMSDSDNAAGFINQDGKIYSVEVDPALLASAGIADMGVEGVDVRATLGGKSPMSEHSYLITAISKK